MVINTFYNDEKEYDELEVRLTIHDIGFPKREFGTDDKNNLKYSFSLNQVAIYNLIQELNIENKTRGMNIIVKDKKIFFQIDYNGLKINLNIKSYDDQIFMKDFSAFIEFYAFNLMCATGQHTDIIFDIYSVDGENTLMIHTDEYSFAYNVKMDEEVFKLSDEGFTDAFIVDPENINHPIQLLNRINKSANISVAKIEKDDEKNGEITIEHDGRYSATARIVMAMYLDDDIYIDSDILEALFVKTNVNGIKAKSLDDKLYIKYENQLLCYRYSKANIN